MYCIFNRRSFKMLPNVCKQSYRIVNESVVKLRRFYVNCSKDISGYQSDYENEEFVEEPILTNSSKVDNVVNKQERKCIIKCKIPKFNFYENQTYPKFEPIPLASRGWHHRKSIGDHFTIYPVESNIKGQIDESKTFKNININKQLIINLEKKNIVNPTQIQVLGIPKILNGQNIIMTAETGCGKTLAFLLPLLHQIIQWKTMHQNKKFNSPLGLIITPSYDLTHQIYSEAKQLVKSLDVKIMKFVGGNTKRFIKNPPIDDVDIVISSLGVLSKLVTWEIYNLNYVRHVILDEADVLLDETFRTKLCLFLDKIPIPTKQISDNPQFPNNVQLTLSSATIPQDIPEKLKAFTDKIKLESVTSGNQHQITVLQKFLRISSTEKSMMLLKLVKAKIKSKIPIIIFSNTTATCDYTSLFLSNYNIKSLNLHGNLSPKLKKGRFMDFQNANCNILTTTDAGARGLDTTMVKEIINYDFPLITSEYIHRCGRTGRIGSPRDCRVINFICRPLEIILTSKIEFAIRKGKPIPMVDTIHNQDFNEKEFLNYNSMNKNNDKMKPVDNDTDNDNHSDSKMLLRIPQ